MFSLMLAVCVCGLLGAVIQANGTLEEKRAQLFQAVKSGKITESEFGTLMAQLSEKPLKIKVSAEKGLERELFVEGTEADMEPSNHGGKGEWVESFYDYDESDAIIGTDDGADDLPVCLIPKGSPWASTLCCAKKWYIALEMIAKGVGGDPCEIANQALDGFDADNAPLPLPEGDDEAV